MGCASSGLAYRNCIAIYTVTNECCVLEDISELGKQTYHNMGKNYLLNQAAPSYQIISPQYNRIL